MPEVPDNISDLDSQLEYMLRPSQTMRRRVELKVSGGKMLREDFWAAQRW